MPNKKNIIKYKKALNYRKYGEMLDDICSEYCTPGKHCLLKLFLLSSHPDPRILIQMKCVEKYKYELNKTQEEEMSWEEAWLKWIDNGCAEKFSQFYDEETSYLKIYRAIMSYE